MDVIDRKTSQSKREFLMPREVTEVLKQLNGNQPKGRDLVFKSRHGKILDEHNFYMRHWLAALERCNIRRRPFYNTRHSYISFFLSLPESRGGKSINFISKQCGVSAEIIRRRYWRWIQDKQELTIPKEENIFTPAGMPETGT